MYAEFLESQQYGPFFGSISSKISCMVILIFLMLMCIYYSSIKSLERHLSLRRESVIGTPKLNPT